MAAGGIGSQLSSPPISLINTGNAITRKYFTPLLPDSIFKPSPTWWTVTRLGKKLQGGGSIVWAPVTSEETTGGAYWGVQTLPTSPSDSVQPAEIQWKAYQQAVVIPVLDSLLNEGEGVIPLVRAKQETAMGSLLQKLSRAVYGSSPQNTALDLDSIVAALGALGGTYAGITIADPWASNGGLGPATGAAALSLANMMTDYMSASQGNEQPDRIFTTSLGYSLFWGLLQTSQRQIEDSETIRAGFKMHLMFNNAVVMWDAFVPPGEMEMITSKYFRPIFLSRDYFNVDPFIQPTNQRVLVARIYITLNMQFLTLRQMARRTNITGA